MVDKILERYRNPLSYLPKNSLTWMYDMYLIIAYILNNAGSSS